jgi:hypothetical protein
MKNLLKLFQQNFQKNPRVKLEIRFPIIVKENAEKSISIQFYFIFHEKFSIR